MKTADNLLEDRIKKYSIITITAIILLLFITACDIHFKKRFNKSYPPIEEQQMTELKRHHPGMIFFE